MSDLEQAVIKVAREERHLHRKYNVYKYEEHPQAPGHGFQLEQIHGCFVLRPDRDAHAREAIRAYADSVNMSNHAFANELREWMESVERALEWRRTHEE